MGQYRIQSKSLGVDFLVEGDEAPNEKSTFEILKQVVPPDQMIKAYKAGNKDLARAAYKNGYFDQDSDTGLYDAFKQAAGEVFEGLGSIVDQPFDNFQRDAIEGMPAEMRMKLGVKVPKGKSRKATAYQTVAEVYGGYKSIGDAGKMAFSKMVGEGDEDIDASIEFIGDMMATQSFIDDGASIMAEKFGDIDMYNDLKMGRVEPDKKQALAASLFVQLENPVAMATTTGLRSTTNLLRRGTAKKLAQDLQKAQSKQFLYSNQLNRLAADAPKNLVKTADDALQGATKEVNDILEKLNPYTKQKAKAGMTNQVVGKAMQGMGRAGEYVGNVTEFIRRAGIEEATTFLMKSGLSETAAKTVIFGSVGLATDMTDGEASLTGSGINALAAYLGPRAIASMGRSSAILGKQLTMAETSMPFFKRIGALPADNPKLAEVIVDRTDNLLLGDAASQLKPLLSQARELPSLVRNAARTIDRTGLGRVATGAANVAKAAVGGAALPGTFGYMIGGGEGAAAAIGASSPFIAAGLGYGSLLRYANKSDLIAKQLGDVEYHKQSLGERERADFEKLAKDQQVAVSTFSQFYPDAVIKVKSMGKDGPMGAHYVDGSDSVIEINSDKNNPWSTILSHEIGHHVERHGLLPNILEELLGNPEKGKVGVFTQIDKSTGKPKITTDENGMKHYELNDEFRELQKTYIDKLANSNVSEKARQAYETPEQFARELFAEIVADRMITGKTSKRVGQSSIYKGTQKIIESLGDRITGGGFMRKAMHSLGMATNADGSLVKGTGILGKPFKSSKELDNLVKRYEDDTIGLSETEIREQRPVTTDDELDTVIVSPSDPIESLQVFNNGGHFKTDKDGNIKINPITKKPEVFSPSETRQANQALARDLIDSIEARENDLPEGHVTLSETADGKLTGSGKFIDDSIIDELSRTNRYNPSQINFLREASKAGREGIGNQMLLFYYAATGKGGRKYKSLKGGYRDSLVYGITITKDGNVILDTVSLDKLQKNIDFLLKRRGNEVGQAFGGSDPAVIRKNFESMFEKYLDNHAKGILNGDQNPQSGITDKQRDLLNAAFGPVSKAQIADNPTLSNLGERKANTLGTYRSRRLDRIGTMNPTGNTRNVVIDRIRRNLMPGSVRSEGQRSFMPTETFEGSPGSYFRPKSSRDTSAQVRTFKSPVYLKDGSRLSGVADNPEQNPFYGFDKSGQEFSQRREYVNPQDITKSRDSDRTANQIRNELESGQKLFMPSDNTYARPLEEILERIPAQERFIGNKPAGMPVTRPNGKPFLELDLDQKIGNLGVKQSDIDRIMQESFDESGPAANRAFEDMQSKGINMVPPNEAHWKSVEGRTLRDRFWYEISSEAMSISFPEHLGKEGEIVKDMTAATSPLADPNYNSELMISIMSEFERGDPSVTPAVVQKSVADVFSGDFGKQEARKVGSFGQTFKFIAGDIDSPPLPTNDRQVAASFDIPDEAFGQYPVLYEVVARFYNKLRDHINQQRPNDPNGPFQSYQLQAPSWVQTRAESKMKRSKSMTEEEIFEGDAYANAFRKAAQKLRDAGIKVGKDSKTGLPIFTKDVLRDPRVVEILSPLAVKFRESKFGTMEIVTLLHENGKKFAELYDKSLETGESLNIKAADDMVRVSMKLLTNRRKKDKKTGKKIDKPSLLTELAQAITQTNKEITRLELGKGTFEGAMSQNIRIPMDSIPKELHEVYLAMLGEPFLQAAQAASLFKISDTPTPDTFSVFIKGASIDNPNLKTFAEHLSSIGHEANLSQRPNGLVIDVNPMFLEDFSTKPIDPSNLNNLITESFGNYDATIYGREYDSTYIERADYKNVINNFKNRKKNEYIKRIREATGLKAKIAGDLLKGAESKDYQALTQGKRKRVDRIRAEYDKFIRELKSAQSGLRQAAKQLEENTGELNAKLEKRLDRSEKKRAKQDERLAKQNVDWMTSFMPSDPKAPKAQPANRIQQQAPAMPGNRFMAPAASAGAKLSERFR
jgi:hypothetical protein